MARQAIAGTAEYSAALALQRKALRLVIADTNNYAKSQEFLEAKSKKLAIPQDVIVRQFTALTASVKGAGRSTEDAQKVFESIAAGIRGTGGSLEDMKAAMTATAQVFSKGKVSAEELRQQLGERLPGAFTIFAESMGKTPAELDKALEGGKVTLDDFMKFSEVLFSKYGKNAEILAKGPEAAGDRLATAMGSLKDNVGQLLTPIGSSFQDTFTKVIEGIDGAAKALRDFLKIGEEYLGDQIAQIKIEIKQTEEFLSMLNKQIQDGSVSGQVKNAIDASNNKLKDLNQTLVELETKLANINNESKGVVENTEKLGTVGTVVWDNMKAGATAYKNSLIDINKQISDATKKAFTQMEDALVDFVMNGKLSFKDFARSVIADITRIYIRSQILSMFNGLGSLFNTRSPSMTRGIGPVSSGSAYANMLGYSSGPMAGVLDIEAGRNRNALGNVYGKNGIVPFGKGGVVHSPHIFPFKNGIGLLGEAGSESIMPLKRGSDGKLGVIAHGGGTSVVVNVDASGTEVQGDQGQSAALGRAISFAVTEEIAKQKRPGGLLSAA